MKLKIAAAAFGLAVGIGGKLYANHTLDLTMKKIIANRESKTKRVVLADVPEALGRLKTSKFRQCKPTHK